jgi:hypothetical protein
MIACLPQTPYTLRLYIRKTLGGNSDAANKLSAWRTAVEHQFNFMYTWFPALKLKKKNKMFARKALLRTYACSALLCNMRACLRDNQVSSYFGMQAPSLHAYMAFARAQH